MTTLAQCTIYGASWLTASGGVWGLFDKIQDVSSDKFNNVVTNWINGISWGAERRDSKIVIYEMFVKFFGAKHFSFRCLFRSILYSLIVLLISFILTKGYSIKRWDLPNITGLCALFILMILQDYFSLFITRIFLKKFVSSKYNNVLLIFFINIIAAFFISVTIVGTFTYFVFVTLAAKDQPFDIKKFYSGCMHLMRPATNINNGAGLYIDMIYLGSLWIVLIQFAGWITKAGSALFKYFNR